MGTRFSVLPEVAINGFLVSVLSANSDFSK